MEQLDVRGTTGSCVGFLFNLHKQRERERERERKKYIFMLAARKKNKLDPAARTDNRIFSYQ